MNAEKAKDREFSADSFAVDVLSEGKIQAMGDLSRRLFIGNVYWLLTQAARDELDTVSIARKRHVSSAEALAAIRAQIMLERRHPYSGERLAGLLSSKGDVAARHGLDAAQITALLQEFGTH